MNKVFGIIKNIFSVIGLLSCLGFALYFSILNKPIFDNADKEFARKSSPNKQYDIVIMKYEPTSFTTPVFSLYIVPFGEKYSIKSEYFKFNNYKSPSLSIDDFNWKNDSIVIIKRYSKSRVYNFIPEYYDPRYCKPNQNSNNYKKIMIELKCY